MILFGNPVGNVFKYFWKVLDFSFFPKVERMRE
jgi:hypothetical protein